MKFVRIGTLVVATCSLALTSLLPGAQNVPSSLLFHLSGDRGTVADFSRGHTPEPNFVRGVEPVPDGAVGAALSCAHTQLLAYWAPGNIYAQRGTLAFFWRAREAVGPTQFPIFRVGYADHSSWDMVWLRIDYNGHGFDAFVTDANLARVRVSAAVDPFPPPEQWTHLALAWDETRGIRFFVNGRLAATNETPAVLDAGLDQFGPHSRIISPYQVQSDYNFMRGGDIDEVRIYDHMLDDRFIASLAAGENIAPPAAPTRSLAESRWRDEWWWRHGWNRADDPPPYLDAPFTTVRKVEIHDAYDLKRWWWKANDGIRETTWPGVYNRSRLPGRHDYFVLPDWDCYSVSGQSVRFELPDEPWNHVEIAGAAFGRLEVAVRDNLQKLGDRPAAQEKTFHRSANAITGGSLVFTNTEPETPIAELSAYHVTSARRETRGGTTLSFQLSGTMPDEERLGRLVSFIHGRHPVEERALLVGTLAEGSSSAPAAPTSTPVDPAVLPLVHVVLPCRWDDATGGLDGIELHLPGLDVQPTHGELLPMNIRVKDPLWPARDMLDFSFSVKPREPRVLWLDLRDRLLPADAPLHFTITAAGGGFNQDQLRGAQAVLVFKPRDAARPEHEIDRFTQARDAWAMLVEENPRSSRYNLWNRFAGDLADLLRVNPEHELGRIYRAVAYPESPRPTFVQPEPPPGVPLWAFRQVEALDRVNRFVQWYIDNRQIENGEFGGGLSDDTDMTNIWPGTALMGCEPEKIADSLRRVLEACYQQGLFTNGLPTIQTDELHTYEEGINALAQNLMLAYGSPLQLERAMETTRGVASVTGINPAGHRHFRSSYYGGRRVAEDSVWAWSKPYSYLVLHPAYLLADFNAAPAARTLLTELADGLLAHRHVGADGRATTVTTIHFPTDQESSTARGTFPWPLFWSAWSLSGDNKYLAPLFDQGPRSFMTLNANTLDWFDQRESWGRQFLASQESATARQLGSRNVSFVDSHLAWQLTGDKRHLETLYAQQIETMELREYINTEGSLWIDRVSVPHGELQRARLGGVALVRNSLFPGHTVSWRFEPPATFKSLAILIPDATRTAFTVVAHNLDATPVTADMTGWNVEPGEWEITQGLDANGDDLAEGALSTRTEKFERSHAIHLTFPPHATTVLKLRLKTPGTPYWMRPDLGIDRQDLTLNGRTLSVTVHSLGAVDAPASVIAVRDRSGTIVAQTRTPALPAPTDLQPKTARVTLTVPEDFALAGSSVVLDPDQQLGEITRLNNAVVW